MRTLIRWIRWIKRHWKRQILLPIICGFISGILVILMINVFPSIIANAVKKVSVTITGEYISGDCSAKQFPDYTEIVISSHSNVKTDCQITIESDNITITRLDLGYYTEIRNGGIGNHFVIIYSDNINPEEIRSIKIYPSSIYWRVVAIFSGG